MVHKSLEAAENLAERGISAEVVDLRTVYPIDEETVLRSIEKTSRAVVVSESYRFVGIGAEVGATIAEKAFAAPRRAGRRGSRRRTCPCRSPPRSRTRSCRRWPTSRRAVDELSAW